MRRYGRWFVWGALAAVGALAVPTMPVAEDGVETLVESVDATVAEAPLEAAVDAGPALAVRDVSVDTDGDAHRVRIRLSRPAGAIRDFTLSGPPRVVMDVDGPLDATTLRERRFPVRDAVVSRVRAAAHAGRLRVVLDLKKPLPVRTVRQEGEVLVAEIGAETPSTPTAAAPIVPVPILAPVVLAAASMEPVAAEMTEVVPDDAAGDAIPEAAPAPVAAALPPADPAPVVPAPADEIGTPVADAPVQVAQAARVDEVPLPVEPPSVQRAVAAEPIVRPASQKPRKPLVSEPTPLYHGERISLDFKDADILNVLRVLADVSGLNIIATDDVKGKVTLHLKDVPWDQALDLVLRTNRLESNREGSVVRISSVNRLREEREALRAAADAEKDLEALRVKYIRVNYARADEILIDKVKGVLTDRGSVTFDDRTNTIIVRDIARGIADAVDLVQQLDVQSPQVLIEANIVEATEDFARGLGVQWGYRYAAGPTTGNPTGANFPGTVNVGGSGLGAGLVPPNGSGGGPGVVPFLADFPVPANFANGFGPGTGSALDLALGSLDGAHSLSARLTALEEEGKGRIVSRPRVITMNNVAATIQSLTILRVKLPSTGTVINTGAGGAAGGGQTATEKINTGITLVVTPQISADGYILLSIYAKSSQPDFTRAVDGIPNEISREANSNVLIRDGETVVLGGIFRNTTDDRESGLPYLRNVPVLGWAFKRNLRSKRNEELLVFLSPRIVAAGGPALPSAEELWRNREHNG